MTRRPTASLSAKLMRIGAALLVLALASISLTLWVTRQLEGGAAAVNEAGRMRMQTWRLTSAVLAQRPLVERQALVQQFDQSLGLLREGDATRPLFVPWDPEVQRRFSTVESLWAVQRARWSAGQVADEAAFCRRPMTLWWRSTGWCWRSSTSSPASPRCSTCSSLR
ncbi:MAG: type IV pili methyl-accepting chemotaxis transducer N-terminal domain-containing protein [Hydrogenophaga sp.]